MKTVLGTMATLACAGAALAQTGGFSDVGKGHWAAPSVSGLASRAILAPQGKPAKFDGSKPITRYELAVTLWRFVQYMERADKQKKTKDGAMAPIDGPGALRRLIADGYLPASSPLAKDGGKTVTAEQLADAMASVITRSREKTIPISPDARRAIPIEHPGHSGS